MFSSSFLSLFERMWAGAVWCVFNIAWGYSCCMCDFVATFYLLLMFFSDLLFLSDCKTIWTLFLCVFKRERGCLAFNYLTTFFSYFFIYLPSPLSASVLIIHSIDLLECRGLQMHSSWHGEEKPWPVGCWLSWKHSKTWKDFLFTSWLGLCDRMSHGRFTLLC